MDNKNGHWITTEKGVHVFIYDGETEEQAINRTFNQPTMNDISKDIVRKKYDVKEIAENGGVAFQVDSDIMDVVGHIPDDGRKPFIDQIFYKSNLAKDPNNDTYEEKNIKNEVLRKGNATNHILSVLDYFNKKGINEFEVQIMNDNSNALMESLVRKGFVEQLTDYKYIGDDVTYKIKNRR